MVTAATTYQCDACLHETSGYSKRDLEDQGWQWHDAGNAGSLVICGECETKYAIKRANANVTA